MDIIRLTYPFDAPLDAVKQTLAIGYFDGVHTGHQEVLRICASIARGSRTAASVMTFDPHPREVLGDVQSPHYITPLRAKLVQFEAAGMDRCYVLTFNKPLSQLSPERFVHEVLFPLHVETTVVGFNFTYGHLGRGTVEQLRELGGERMKVHAVRPFLKDGLKVSSTLIREHLHAGRMEQVSELLGRPYSITGTVVQGVGRGRTIGIPTANIEPDEAYVVPANGVYAIRAFLDGECLSGVMNVGVKPTFENDPPGRTLEAHLFGFDRMIYGKTIKLEFVAYIRGERKFGSVDELVARIRTDMNEAKSILEFTS